VHPQLDTPSFEKYSPKTPNCQFFTTSSHLTGLCRRAASDRLLLLWILRYEHLLGIFLPVSNFASTIGARSPKRSGTVEGKRTETACTAPASASEKTLRDNPLTSGGFWKNTPRNVNACFACTRRSDGGWFEPSFPPAGFPCWRQKSTWRLPWPKSVREIDPAICKRSQMPTCAGPQPKGCRVGSVGL